MHLKNFSLIKQPDVGWVLCPAYDMVASVMVVKGDTEELALNLNGKKRKINNNDFRSAMKKCHIPAKAIDNIFNKFQGIDKKWEELVEISFLPDYLKNEYLELLGERMNRLYE